MPTRSSGSCAHLMGGDPTTFAGSDHGFAPQYYAVNAIAVLNAATVNGVSLHASNATTATAARPTTDLAKACWAGGTTQIYINPTIPAGDRVVRAAGRPRATRSTSLTDPAHPGKQVVLGS